MSKKKITVAALLILAVGIFAYFKFSGPESGQDSTQSAQHQTKKQQSNDTIRILATGDMLPHDSVNMNAKTAGGYDYEQFFEPIKGELDSADAVFCNQESPSAPDLSISGYPTFNAPSEFAKDISAVGCNIIGLANNHLFDRGQAGIDGTRQVWDGLDPLAVSGANRSQTEQNKVSYFEIKGVKFAFVAFSEISNQAPSSDYSLNFLKENLVNKLVSEANKNADFVIVSAHWGTEYDAQENQVQVKWARIFADLGADLVIGQGPHVLQPVKKIKGVGGNDTVVFYSLGNLLSTQLDIESLIGGLAVIDIDKNTKTIKDVSFYPTYMHYEWTAEEKAKQDLLKRKNLKIYPLNEAADPMSRSQNNTTPQRQLERITDILNKYTPVEIKN